MSSFMFRPAVRESVGLLVGLSGASGSGKTWSAMRLAKGMAGDKRFAVIDTEAGRAKHYADSFAFDHGDLTPPFSPARYAEAIAAADAAGYSVIVVDSASHEHAGEGGILDMQEAEFQRMGGGDNVKMASWIKPKGEHKRMVQKLLQVRAHLILCFRAEEKIEMAREGNKTVVRPKVTLTGIRGWVPICEKNLPFELTASFLLIPDKPGVPNPIKLQEQHKPYFPSGSVLTEESGRMLAAWARGDNVVAPGAVASWTGVLVKVEKKKGQGRVPEYFEVSGAGGALFQTMDAKIADQANAALNAAGSVVSFTTTGKGGKLITAIHSAAIASDINAELAAEIAEHDAQIAAEEAARSGSSGS